MPIRPGVVNGHVIHVTAASTWAGSERLYVKLVPKGDQQMGALTLAVLRSTYDIVEAAIADPVGNLTTLSFSNVTRNIPLPDDEFRFVVPEGTDVVAAPTGAAAP